MNKPFSFDEYLETHDSLTYTNVGVSMLPLLRQRKDLFTIKRKGSERCKAGDVVLYRRPPNHYVLHRIIKILPDSYVILGDNSIIKEFGIKDKDILGVMTSFVRNGKEHKVEEKGYRLYSFVWMHTKEMRMFLKKAKARLAKCARRVLHEK